MAHTNSTDNYNLPQWVGTDKPTFLGDFNGAFAAIDAQMKVNADGIVTADDKAENATTLANDAQDDVDALTTRVATAESDIDANSARISVHDTDIANITQSITTINTALNNKQDTITGAASTVVSNNLTANRTLVSDSDGKISSSSISATKLGYLSGVTSDVQTQINNKLNKSFSLLGSASVGTSTVTITVPNLNNYSELVFELEHGTFTADCIFIPVTLFVAGNTCVLSDWNGTTRNLINVAYVSATSLTVRATYTWSGYTLRVYGR